MKLYKTLTFYYKDLTFIPSDLHERSLSLPPLVNRNEKSNTSAVPINKENVDCKKVDEEYVTKSNESTAEDDTLIKDKDEDSQLAIETKDDLFKEKHSDSGSSFLHRFSFTHKKNIVLYLVEMLQILCETFFRSIGMQHS